MKAKLTLAILAIVGFFAVLGMVGNIDYTEHIILSMTQEEYESIRDKLTAENGSSPSDFEIAEYYNKSHD